MPAAAPAGRDAGRGMFSMLGMPECPRIRVAGMRAAAVVGPLVAEPAESAGSLARQPHRQKLGPGSPTNDPVHRQRAHVSRLEPLNSLLSFKPEVTVFLQRRHDG